MGLGIKTKLIKKRNQIISNRYKKIIINELGINTTEERKQKIIISMTSYPARLKYICICLKSLLIQTLKPDKIILYLGNDTNHSDISQELKTLTEYGVEIKMGYENIKPHKKYYFAMQEYPNDIIITVDDDVIYDKNMIETLIKSYKKHPNAVSARRAHKMLFDIDMKLLPYNQWEFECKEYGIPSMQYFPTGIGGVLYPPHLMHSDLFNLEYIKELCLNADDVWLKFMQLLNNIPVVIVKCRHAHPILIEGTQESALNLTNVSEDKNDVYINNLIDKYKISIANIVNNEVNYNE